MEIVFRRYLKTKMKTYYVQNYITWGDQGKYRLRTCPFIGSSSLSPSNVLSLKVPGPISRWIWYGTNQRFWNFLYFPLISFYLSHLRTISPSWKSLSPTDDLSNHLLITCWCCIKSLLVFSLSYSSFRSISNLCCITRHYLSWKVWASCNEEKKVWVRKVASCP